jgi:hypothetical protein
MAVEEVKFYVLDVGQGSCNYVEIIDDNRDVIHNMLIDIGTDSQQEIADDNIEWLKNQIKDRANPRIDVVVLTHGDKDHYNMILRLQPALAPADTARIGMIRYGGDPKDYTVLTPLKTLEAYCDDIGGFEPGSSGYDSEADDPWADPIWPEEPEEGDVELRQIVANLPVLKGGGEVAKPTSDARKNTGSVVVGVFWNDYWIVCTGDATGSTLAGVNEKFKDAKDLPHTFSLTAPHHGSVKTTYDLKAATDKPYNEAIEVVNAFLDIFKPDTVSFSAGEKMHHHASMFVVEQMARHTPDILYWLDDACKDDRHFITTWIGYTITEKDEVPKFPETSGYATTQTEKNVYTTHYFCQDPYNKTGKDAGAKSTKRQKVDSYPYRYVYPPADAVQIKGDATVDDIPVGRNFEFYMTDDEVGMDSTENEARARAMKASVAPRRSAPPPSFFAAPGRALRAALAPQPAPPAVRRGLPLLEPAFHPLKSLRTVT